MIATKPSRREVKKEKIRRKLQNDFTKFKQRLYKRYEHAAHLELLDSYLEQVTEYVESGGERGIGRLIIEMPPRHGKTLTTSKLYPVWHLGRNPSHRIMLVAYGHTLAHKNSRLARNLMRSPWYQAIFPRVQLAKDSAAADAWNIEGDEGGCDAMGITGGATGKGAHILIIDDPIKNRQEAESEVYRERVWDAYTNDLYTRLEPGGAIIIIHTRWHKDDLIGRVLKQLDADNNTDEWVRLRLPAIAEDDNDPLNRKPGEELWKWRYPAHVLKRISKAVGRYVWAALYQQRPQPRAGGLFKYSDIEKYRASSHPDLERIVIAIDPSGSASGDEVGIGAAGVAHDGHAYVLKDLSLQASPKQWANVAINAYDEFQADVIVAEKNYGGEMVEYTLRTIRQEISYRDVNATRGKVLRAEPVASLYEQGLVHHVGDNFAKLEDEMTTWKPGDKSPNRMDWLVWALTELKIKSPSYVFPEFSEYNISAEFQYDKTQPVYCGIHEGYSEDNPRGAVLVQVIDKKVYVRDEYIGVSEQAEVSIDNIINLRSQKPALFMTGHDPKELRYQLRTKSLYNGTTNHKPSDGIKVIQRYIANGDEKTRLIIHPKCERLIDQIKWHRFKDDDNPLDEDNQLVKALSYILWNFR